MFAAPTKESVPVTHEEIKDLQAKIYKLFLQVLIALNVTFVCLIFVSHQKRAKKKKKKNLLVRSFSLSRQPVHNNGSSGYGSLGSNGSHEHYISVASSSDSNGNLWEDTHREPVSRGVTFTPD